MSSREIALLTSKQHKHVLEAIRNMESAWEKVSGTKFRLAEYIDEQGKPRPMYKLTKTETLYIATKFNDEARARLILRWEELEQQQQQTTLRITSSRPAISIYQPRDLQELTQDFRGLIYKELIKVESTRTRLRMARIIDFYTDMINDQLL